MVGGVVGWVAGGVAGWVAGGVVDGVGRTVTLLTTCLCVPCLTAKDGYCSGVCVSL